MSFKKYDPPEINFHDEPEHYIPKFARKECTCQGNCKKKTEDKGLKYDDGKAPIGLISSIALTEEANVLAFGAKKYDNHNWRKGMQWSRLIDAALRHIIAYKEGEDKDPETGLSHLAHARCCMGFLLDYEVNHKDKDDRYKK